MFVASLVLLIANAVSAREVVSGVKFTAKQWDHTVVSAKLCSAPGITLACLAMRPVISKAQVVG